MRNRNTWLIVILILVAVSLWVDLSNNISITNPLNQKIILNRDTQLRRGLDTLGGLQTLLEADVANCSGVDPKELDVTRQILESRANGLGVSEIVMQTAGQCRIVAEFPGVSNPEEVVAALQQTALLEFVDMGTTRLDEGTVITTDYGQEPATGPTTTPPATTATPEAAATSEPGATPGTPSQPQVYHTVMTGASLDLVSVGLGSKGYQVDFTLKPDASQVFADYTTSHVGQILAIVLDKKVISTPSIENPITGGTGTITGNFTQESANALAINLRYGSLPVPVKVVESRTVGPTLGEESVRKSLLAGVIGLSVVVLFMALYYRLPGVIADVALLLYALINLMIYKVGIPPLFPYITLTLPGIAGFILSIGMAVDANILIFERLKEELRSGRSLRQAIDLGWSRAWPSIRDSNTSTLITCLILFIFGNTFGASMVKGFSVNLALGVVISLFTAIIVTRTFLHLVLDNVKLDEHPGWFGL
jgi:preprotein translocase subunit SecD